MLVVADPVPGELSSDDQSDISACDAGRAPDRDRRPLVIEHVALLLFSPWFLLELGFFFLSEDLALPIRYPLAVEQVGMSTISGGSWVSAGANLKGTKEHARRGAGGGVGGVEGRQIRGGDGEQMF